MSAFKQFAFRLRALFRKEKLDAEMAEEMRLHVELRTQRNIEAGMSAADARFAAQRSFGGTEQIKERARDHRGWVWFEQLLQDLRYAIRTLQKNPTFTVTAVLTLAFGIGVNAALFTLYNAVALRPLPVRDPDSLVKILVRPGRGVSYAEYLDYREGNQTLSGLTAFWNGFMKLGESAGPPDPMFDLRGDDFPGSAGMVGVRFVSDNYFAVLGADLLLGRGFQPEGNRAPSADPVIVLSHLFWQRQLHGDPNVLGTAITLDGKLFTVTGVTAPGFVGHEPAPPAGWAPITMMAWPRVLTARDIVPFSLVGRLKPGVSDQQVRADFDRIASTLPRRSPTDRTRYRIQVERGMRFLDITLNHRALVFFAPIVLGFLLVLVIASTNVANLLLARGVTRRTEIGVRLALGASRGRVIRQLLTENLLLCVLAAVAGMLLGRWTVALALGLVPAEWGHAGEVRQWQFLNLSPDGRIAALTAGLALLATVVAGLIPALWVSQTNLISTLKAEGPAWGFRLSLPRLRNVLVVLQVAVCLMLLAGTGLVVRNLIGIRRIDPGYDPRSVFRFSAGPKSPLPDARAQAAATRQAAEVLRTFPGVVSAGWALGGPIGGMKGITTSATVPGARDPGFLHQGMRYSLVSSGFFGTFGIPLRRGRTFTADEVEAGAPVVIISESTARRLWPGEEPLGKLLAVSESAFAWPPAAQRGQRACEVIGVIRDIRNEIIDPEPVALFLPLSPAFGTTGVFLLRPRHDAATALADLTRRAETAGITLTVRERWSTRLEEGHRPFLVAAWISAALGSVALLMASVGLFGMMAFTVNQRVREIGIRVALGATAGRVVALFLAQGMKLVAVGAGLGLAGGVLFALLLKRFMFGLSEPIDPLAFGLVTLLLAAVALLACWLPTRRATRVSPMVALRCE